MTDVIIGCIGVGGVDFNVVLWFIVRCSMGFWKTDVYTINSVRSSAVVFHGVDVGPVRPPGKLFEREAGKVDEEGVHISPGLLPGSYRRCF